MLTRSSIPTPLKLALCGLVLTVAALSLGSSPAAANGHGGGRVFFGFGVNTWGPPAYYYPPPYYYYPPPAVVYAPAPAYGTVQPIPAAPTYQAPVSQTCREYQTTVMVDGQAQPSYGTACLQPDGTWRIIN